MPGERWRTAQRGPALDWYSSPSAAGARRWEGSPARTPPPRTAPRRRATPSCENEIPRAPSARTARPAQRRSTGARAVAVPIATRRRGGTRRTSGTSTKSTRSHVSVQAAHAAAQNRKNPGLVLPRDTGQRKAERGLMSSTITCFDDNVSRDSIAFVENHFDRVAEECCSAHSCRHQSPRGCLCGIAGEILPRAKPRGFPSRRIALACSIRSCPRASPEQFPWPVPSSRPKSAPS
jgi:hypothetical protein